MFIVLFIFCIGVNIDNINALELGDGVYIIESKLSDNKVLSAQNDNIINGSNIELNTFNYGEGQKWSVEKLDDGYYVITNYLNNNLSLDVAGGSRNNGTNILLWNKHGADNQKWLIKDAGDGYYYLVSKCNNLNIDVSGGDISDGTNILNWTGHGADNQKFKFLNINEDEDVIEDGTYMINSVLASHLSLSVNSGLKVNISNTNASYSQLFNIKHEEGYYIITTYKDNKTLGLKNGNVEIIDGDFKWKIKKWLNGSYSLMTEEGYCLEINMNNDMDIFASEYTNSTSQRFKFLKIENTQIEEGVYTISSVNKNFVVSANNMVGVNGVNIYLENLGDNNNQKWYIENIKENIYEIKSALDSKYVLEVAGGGLINNDNVQLHEKNNTDSQRWYAVKLEDGYYHFINVKSSKCLDIYGGNFKSLVNISQYDFNYSNAQKFELNKTKKNEYKQIVENGKYIIYSSVNLNKSIRLNYINDVEGSDKEIINIQYDGNGLYVLKNGEGVYTNYNGEITIQKYSNSDNQKWFLVKEGQYYVFYSKLDGRVWDVPNSNVNNGTEIITWKYHGDINQKFYFEAVEDVNLNSGYYQMNLDNKFLSINTEIAYNRSKALLKYEQNDDSQKWYFNRVDNNLYEIKYGLNVGKTLDVTGANKSDGTDVILYTSRDGDNQKWFIINLKNGGYKLISKHSHKVLSIDNDYAKIYSNLKNENQTFIINATDPVNYGKVIEDGYYIISSYILSSKVFDLTGASIANGTNVILFSEHKGLNQLWKIKYLGNGMYTINSALNPKKVLTNNNGNIQISKNINSDAQKWYIKVLENGTMSFISILDGTYITVNGKLTDNVTNMGLFSGNNSNLQKFILNSYTDKKTYRGIDISRWQGNIDFSKLSKENLNFIIMRVGRGIKDLGKDTKFNEYYENANKYDIPVGVYIYSFASNLSEAKMEADYAIKWLEGRDLDLPVFYDMEYSGQLYLGKEVITKMAEIFCANVIKNNYHCGIYASSYWLTNFIDGKEISKNYPIWLAHWTGANDYNNALLDKYKSTYTLSPYLYWQFTDKGKLSGITENTVDLDFGYDIFD